MDQLEAKAQKKALAIKIGIFAVAAFIFAPFAFMVVKGMIGLMIAGAIGFAGLVFAPLIGQKLANWKLKEMKAEAAKNPIETLQLQLQDKKIAISNFGQGYAQFSARIKTYEAQVIDFKRRYPDKAHIYEDRVQTYLRVKAKRKQMLEQAQVNVRVFEDKIEEASAEWDMAMADKEMNKAANFGNDVMNDILTKTALLSVQNTMNQSFAALEELEISSNAMLDSPHSSLAIEGISTKIQEKVKV